MRCCEAGSPRLVDFEDGLFVFGGFQGKPMKEEKQNASPCVSSSSSFFLGGPKEKTHPQECAEMGVIFNRSGT